MQNSVLFYMIRKHREAEELLWNELNRRKVSWKTYANECFKVKAIFLYRQSNGGTIADAKAFVEMYLTNH